MDGLDVANILLLQQPELGDGVPDLDRIRVLGGDGLEGLTIECHLGRLDDAAVDHEGSGDGVYSPDKAWCRTLCLHEACPQIRLTGAVQTPRGARGTPS